MYDQLPNVQFIFFKCFVCTGCATDTDCSIDDGANVCSGWMCVCGNLGAACSGTTPYCGKSDDIGMKADPGDYVTAQCQVPYNKLERK